HFAGDLHRFFGDLARRKLRVLGKSLGSSLSERASAADSGNTPIGFNHITLATQQERLLFVGDQQQSFEVAQELVRAPVFCQLYRTATEVPVILLQLGLETAEEGERVGGRTRETGKNLVLVQPSDLFRIVFHHARAARNLTVPSHNDMAVAANT